MPYLYGSISSSSRGRLQVDSDEDGHYHEPSCSWKMLLLILFPSIIFAAFVGHIVTIAFIGATKRDHCNKKNHPPQKSLDSQSQAKAEEYFHNYLSDPCMLSEKFYNTGTDAGTDAGNDSPPPPLPPPDGCTAILLILRHCEAGLAREHCGYMGNLRSQYIATLFGNTTTDRWPEPSYIFAMAAGERHNDAVNNWREIETVVPLSEKVNVTIDTSFGFPEKKKFVNHLYKMLRKGEMCGKVAVISWKHHDIPDFSHSLGCGPENGCPDSFDENDYETVWELTYSYHKEKYAPYVVEDTSRHGLKKRRPFGVHPEWFVYGSLQQEGFDYLQFAKSNGSF